MSDNVRGISDVAGGTILAKPPPSHMGGAGEFWRRAEPDIPLMCDVSLLLSFKVLQRGFSFGERQKIRYVKKSIIFVC